MMNTYLNYISGRDIAAADGRTLERRLHREPIGPNTGTQNNPVERRKNWNGIMRYIGASAGGILEQNITSLEIWVKTTPTDPADLQPLLEQLFRDRRR